MQMKIGNIDISVIKDSENVFGQIPRDQWEPLAKPDRRNRVRLSATLLQALDKNPPIDTGADGN